MSLRGGWAVRVRAGAISAALLCSAAGAAAQVDTLRLSDGGQGLPATEGMTHISSVRELSDGRLLLTDPREQRLVVLDFGERSLQQIGRRGQGPREYEYPGRLYPLGGDSTLLTDIGTHRWFLLDETTIVGTFSATRVPNRRVLSDLSGASRAGSVLGVEDYLPGYNDFPGDRATSDSLRVLLFGQALASDEAQWVDTVAQVGGRGRFGVRRVREGPYVHINPSPVAPEEEALLFPDGWIVIARAEPYRVEWRRPDGSWVHGEPLPYSPIAVTREELCFAIARRRTTDDCREDLFPEFPDELPPFLTGYLFPVADGSVLVHRTPAAAHGGFHHYDVVGRDGALKSVIQLPVDRRIVGLGAEWLYTVHTDELDVEHVSRHRWN